jgi:opacity protein-like surface antigen
MKRNNIWMAFVVGLALSQVPLDAQARARRGLYAGGFLSRTQNDTDAKVFDDSAAAAQNDFGLTRIQTSSVFDKGDTTTFGFVVGYRWLKNLAFELDYLDLGKQRYRANDIVSDGTENFGLSTVLRNRTSGIGLSALAIQPLGDYFEIFARGGLVIASSRQDILLADDAGNVAFGSDNHSSIDPSAGVGVSVIAMDTYSLRLEYRRVFGVSNKEHTGGGDISLATAGLIVRF